MGSPQSPRSETSLVLFFTRGISLHTWERLGSLERELALYRALRPELRDITLVTYGGKADLQIARHLKEFHVVANRWGLPVRWYTHYLEKYHSRVCPPGAIVRSNQVRGAEVALHTAKRRGGKFIARCGYLPSNIMRWRHGDQSSQAREATRLEAEVFQGADRVVVTTTDMQNSVIESYQVSPEKVRIIPNFVETDVFKPLPGGRRPRTLSYVGRLEPEKNVEALIEAVRGLDVELKIIGGGSLREQLEQRARQDRSQVHFLGNVPNNDLPKHLCESLLFVLPSHLEHHPKALLEAMACGLPVIGTNVYGIRSVLRHGETGYLCGSSAPELREAISEVLKRESLRAEMGRRARRYVEEHCAFERVLDLERNLLEDVSR